MKKLYFLLLIFVIVFTAVPLASVTFFSVKDETGKNYALGTGQITFSNISGTHDDIYVITGDMKKDVYDLDEDGRVDKAETVDDGTDSSTAGELRTHLDNADIHRQINDSGSGTTDLWSASKIQSEIATGTGDMQKSVYDTDTNDLVDKAETVDDGTDSATASELRTHLDSTSNPHSVSKTDVGLENVTNDAQLTRSAGDFSTFPAKTAPILTDVMLLEDSENGAVKRYAPFSTLPFLTSEADDFSSFPAKTAPIGADILLIEDSENAGAKRFINISSLPFGTGGGAALTVTDDTTTVNDVATLRFEPTAGFSVVDDTGGQATINLGSSFNPWLISGFPSLSAVGEEPIELIAGTGISLYPNITTNPKSLTISAEEPEYTIYQNIQSDPVQQEKKGILYSYGPAGVGGNDEYTVLLIQSETYDGDTAVEDSSSYNHAITNNGVTHSTTQAKFGSSSLHFVRSQNDYLKIPETEDVTVFNFGEDEFCIDFWAYSEDSHATYAAYILTYYFSGASGWRLMPETQFRLGGGAAVLSAVMPTDEWVHVAVLRSGDTLRLFFNGVLQDDYDATGISVLSYDHALAIGTDGYADNASGGINAYLEEIRISRNTPRWATTSFTPPEGPYTLENVEQELRYVKDDGTVVRVAPIPQFHTKDENVTLEPEECSNSIIQAEGVILTLPAVANVDNGYFSIYANNTSVVTITPDAGDRIRLLNSVKADGVSIASGGQIGESISLFKDSADGWSALHSQGGWN